MKHVSDENLTNNLGWPRKTPIMFRSKSVMKTSCPFSRCILLFEQLEGETIVLSYKAAVHDSQYLGTYQLTPKQSRCLNSTTSKSVYIVCFDFVDFLGGFPLILPAMVFIIYLTRSHVSFLCKTHSKRMNNTLIYL